MEIGIAIDNTIPLYVPRFIEFVRAHSTKIRCHQIKAPLRFPHEVVGPTKEIDRIRKLFATELNETDSVTLFVTTKPLDNNYFYVGSGRIAILSFSDWHVLTNLPMSNGLAYFLCQYLIRYELNIGGAHDEITGCVNDFLMDKTGIDIGMRAAYLCDKCKSTVDSTILLSQEYLDIISMLNSISIASRKGEDIFNEMSSGGIRTRQDADFDVFLCHNNADKLEVRITNNKLKNGGIKTWLDEERINPGEIWANKLEEIINDIKSCLIIVGNSGFGPWQDIERRAFISEFATRGCKVIPTLIGSPSQVPQLPLFLRQFAWSDLRNDDGHNLARLIGTLLR